MTLTQAMQSPFRQTTYTEQEEEQIRKRVEESIKQKIDAMAPVRGKQETVEVNNQTFKVDSLDTVQQKNNLQAQKAVELSTPLLEKQEENTEPLDTTPFANKNYSYKDVENFAEEQGMSMEQANENAVKLIRENPTDSIRDNTAVSSTNKIWKGLNEDFMSFDAYDYERKEQTDQQKAWESFVRSAKEARSTDELMLTQGQKLGEFRQKATELTDILWNMYSSAGSTKKVDRIYGATLDAYLSAFFGKPISEIANNREKYKTLVMGRNVDDVSTLEAMGRAFQSDSLSTRIAMNEWMYFITKDSRYQDNVDELSKVQQRFYTDYADRNKVSQVFIDSMPILAQGLKMWATLMVTGGIGSAIGSAVGLKKALGEAVTASLYASLGQKIGVGVGYGISAMDTFMRESGSTLVELSQLRDDMGNKIDDDLILQAGFVSGVMNTFWEYLTPEPFTSRMTRFNFKTIFKNGVASTLSNILLNSLAGGISESTEEFLQTFTSDFTEYIFKNISNAYDGTSFDMTEDTFWNWLADGAKSFGQAFFPSMLVGLAGTGRAYVQDVITNVITNEDYRKNFKTEALRTLDTYTTPENSTYNYRKEAETNQVVPSRNSRIVSEFGISIEGGKLSKEERQQIREKYENEDGKMPAIVVRWDSEKRMYTPIDEENNKIAQYLYSDKRAKGFVVEYRNAESVQYPSSTVAILTRNNRGSVDEVSSTITFDTSRDRENFLSNFEGEIMTDLDDSTTELKIKNDKGEDITYTVKLSKVNQDNTGFDSSQTKQEDTNTTNNVRTKKVQDQNGNVYEVFDKSDVLDMLTYALPSMSEREASTIAEWINLLPANIQDSIIQKLKKSNGDIRDFIISADDYAMENNYSPEVMKKLERGRAIALINEARIVLKDGKTRGKDVVHEVFHVLWNLFPEYRSDLVKGVTTTLNDTASREQLKRWYEDNRDALNSLKGNKFKNETVGKVNSWESFLSLLETVSDEKVEADIKSGNPAIEELFARMSTAILIDPSEGAMNSLPATLRDIFKKIVQKLKSLYKGLIGEFNNRNFAPRTLEDAVLSIYQDDNTYTATDNLNQRVRYSEEFDDKYKDIVDEYTSIMHLALSTMNMTTEQKDKTRIKLRKMLGLPENGDISVNQITYALSKYYKEIAGERDFGDYKNPNNVSLFSNILTKEIKGRVKVAPENSAVGWYSEKIDLMHSIVGEAFPEINTDPNGAGFIFDVLVAMTSQGQPVEQNFYLAINAYESYKKTGLLPTDAGNGMQANATNNNIGKINAMLLGGMSIEEIRRFFERQWTGAQLRDMGYDVTTNMDEKDYGSIILGPKIGGAFFSNIRGNHEIPTLDKWMSRVLFPFTGYTYNEKILGSEKDAIGFETFTNPDRKFFLDVANDVRKKLKRNPNFKGITVADIQAVLWYNIKTLYDAIQKQASTSLGTDYATASAKVFATRNADELGLTGKKRKEWINDEIQRLVDGAKHRRVQEGIQDEGGHKNLGSTGMDTNLSEILPTQSLADRTQTLGETSGQGRVEENRQIPEGLSSSNSIQRPLLGYNDRRRHEEDLSRRRGDLASVPRVLPWWQSGTRSVYGLGVRNSSFLTEVKTFINNDGSKTYNPVRIIPFTDNSFVRVAYSQEMFVGRELADYISVNTDGHVALPDDISFLEISRDKSGKTYSAGSFAFVTAMNKAVENLKAQDKGRNLTVDVPTVNDINNGNYKLYLSSDGKAGFALHGDEIKAVFADPSFVGASYMIMPMAIALGGRRLDCFDGKVGLQNVYARFGFKPVARIEFSYDAFEDNAIKRAWKKQVDNLGKPDVYFMVLDKNTLLSNPNFQKEGFVPSPEEIPLIKGENNYSEALQKAEDIAKATASDFGSDMNLVTYKSNFIDTNNIYATRDQIESSLNETNDRFESLFRYSEELEGDDTQDYGDTFNVDNPKSIINRNIRTWDALVDSDVDQFIAQDIYLPTEVLKQHDSLKSVQQEIEDRNEIDLHLEIYPQIRDIASESKTVGEFIQRVKKDVYSTNLTDNDERLLRKYYNYSQTLSPTDFLSWFTEMYANEKQTTLDDLLALKKVMGIRREAKVTSNGDRVYTVVANDTRLSKVLSQIDKNSTDAEVKKAVKEIKRRAMGYMKDFARTLLRSEKASALKNTSFNPVTSSWLAIALGSSQEDAYQAHLKADSTSSEMSDATSSTDTSDTILRSLNEAINLNADEREVVVKNIQSLAKSNPFLASLVELGNMNPKEVTISMLVRAINKLEEQIDTEVLSKDDYRNRYNLLRGEIKKLNKENREQLAQINSLFKEAVGYLDKIDDYKANYKRLQKLLMYTQLFAKLDQKTLKAYYKEILARNSARTSLRNAMSYNSSTYDAYHIDPVMKYLYKFIHNTEKTFNSVSENEYVNKALKRGEATDSGEVAFTTYDFVDLTSDDMEEVEALYNPNSPRIDLSDMPSVLENALPVELANAIKNGQVTFYELDSKSLNQIRSALAIAKQLSKMSKKEKDSVRGTRRRNRAMSIFNGQYNLDVKNMSTDMRNSIIDKMNADPNYRKSSLMYSDEELEDYIRKNPRAVFSAMADDDKGVMRKLYDAVGPSYMKMQRVAEWMDGRENGPIYNEFFRPLFESYEQKMRWVNKRQAEAGNSIRTILGDGNATDKKTIRANKKLLEQEEVLKNNTVNDGQATIKVNGWDKIGIYIYSKNIFGFIKLISSSGNNIALEEVAKINPEYTKRFIELALAQREQNELVNNGLTNKEIWRTSAKNDGTDYYARDILNHVSLETLEDVLSKLNSGEIPMTSSINGISTKLGDELIRLVSARQSEVVKAGYDEYNMLTVLQDNYFPLVALDDNLFRIEEQNSKSRVSRGLLMRRQMTDTYALSLNPLANFYRAISNQEALINMASTIDDMHWLMDARGGNLKGIISQKFGTAWGKYFEEYLNAMAGAGDRNLSDLGKLANKFIGNIAVSRIGANLMVSAKQLISTIPAMTQGELTPWEVLNALGKLTGNKKESWKQFIEQQSPSTFYSAYNIEAENARKFDETMANDSVMSDLRETTMWLTEKLDGMTKGAIWIAKYQKEINNGASVQDASFRATQLVQTTQSITDTPSLSQLQRNKNPLVRVAFMFTNDLFQTWNTVTRDVQMFKDKETRGRAIKELLGIALSNAVLAFLAGGWLKDDDDDDDENTMFADFLKDWGVEFFNDIPVVGQVFDISGYDSNYYTGFDKAKNLFDMFSNQATYWKTNGKKGKDYEAGDYADKLFTLVMEGGLSLTGAPVTTMERGYKSVFPNGMAEGITKSPTSFYYMLGSRWGKSLFMDK